MSILSNILVGAVLAGGGYLIAGAALAISQSPVAPEPKGGKGLDFSEAKRVSEDGIPAMQTFRARDGVNLPYRRWPTTKGAQALILVHGSSWHGRQFWELAPALAAKGYDVIVPDMRGHGENPVKRGDTDHIGQYEEDIADLIENLGLKQAGSKIIIGGHSAGGGFVLRFAGGKYSELADGYLLLAPFLGHNAPTVRQNAGGWAHTAVRRLIGLSMLNKVGVTQLNHLPVLAFSVPEFVRKGPLGHTVTDKYSYRLLASYSPHLDFNADLKAMTKPVLLVSGANDEAFLADLYEPTISAQTSSGEYHLLDGVNHLGVIDNAQTPELIGNWVEKHFSR